MSTPPATPLAALAPALVDWQRLHGRHALPWQGTRDPYRVWLSEIMLQQTQVSTVLGYFDRFLQHFPDVTALAAAELDAVLALWAGLGYYSRARNLHRCAQVVAAEHGGQFPRSAALLQTLPGIGRSTAAAIAAFCYDERAAILDGNVKRVLSRVLGFGDDLAVAANEKALWALAEQALPADGESMPAYTQGLMDLGASTCSVRKPDCGGCALAALCTARNQGRPEAYPVKTRKLKRSCREWALLWLRQGDAHWLVQRPATGVWAGLWSWPEFASVDALRSQLHGWPGHTTALPGFKHVLTHLDLHLSPVVHVLPPQARHDGVLQQLWPEGCWVAQADLSRFGMPAPVAKRLMA